MPAEVGREADRLESLIRRQHRILGVYVTFRCPLECAHCGVESHPGRRERIDPALALDQIQKAADHAGVRTVHVNGGEPFLERKLLVAISRLAERLGLGLAITTSAHWATSVERARRVLAELPVLSQLMISTDRYHLPYVRLDNVARAARAGVERKALTQVAICTPTGAEDEFVDDVRAALGPDLLDLVELIVFPLDPVGRAAEMPEAQWRDVVDELPPGRCVQLNRPVLLDDGTLSACCNTLVTGKRPEDNPLKLGNCRSDDIDRLLPRAEHSFYIQAIRVGGPALLARIAAEYGAEEVLAKSFRRGDICHLCDHLLHDRKVQAALERALADRRVQLRIAALRATVLGEEEMLKELTSQSGESTTTTKGAEMDFVKELDLQLVPKLVKVRDGWHTFQKELDRERLIGALVETYHYIRHSVPLMEIAAERCATSHPGLADYYREHCEEEKDHDVWLLEDLETLGLSAEEVQGSIPLAPTLGMVASQYYFIERINPAALLGYMYILEGLTPKPENVKLYATRAGIPEGAMRTILEHAELDPHHVSEMREALGSEELSEQDLKLIVYNAEATLEYLAQMYNALHQQAAAASALRDLKIPA